MASLSEFYDRSSLLVTQVPSDDDSDQGKKPSLVYSAFATMVLGFAIMASNIGTEATRDEFEYSYLEQDPTLYIPRAVASNEKSSVFIKRHGDASIDPKVYAFKTFSLKRHRHDADEVNKEIIREYLPCLIPTLKESQYVARTLGAQISPIVNTDIIRVEILMEGAQMSLADLQESRRAHQNCNVLDLLTKMQLCGDVCRGLHAVHSAGLAHGDVKSENILIFESADPSRAFHAKVADFGLAPLVTVTEEDAVDIIGGTWPWQAPELQPGYPPARPFTLNDVRMMDYYSLGLLCWRVYIDGIWPYKHHHIKEALKEFAADSESAVWLMKKNYSATKLAIQKSIDFENSPRGAGIVGIRAAEILCAVVPQSRKFRRACQTLMVFDLPDVPIQTARGVVAEQIKRMTKSKTFDSTMFASIFWFPRLQRGTYRSIVAEASQADITAGSQADIMIKYLAVTLEIKWMLNPTVSTQNSTSDLFEKFKVAITLELQNHLGPATLSHLCRIQKDIWPNIAGQDLDFLKLAINYCLSRRPTVELVKGRCASITDCAVRLGMYSSLEECQDVLRQYDSQRLDEELSSRGPQLFSATFFGSFEDLLNLLQNEVCDLDETDMLGNTSLHLACILGDFDKAIVLLEHGARTDVPNADQLYPIYMLGCFEISPDRYDLLFNALSVKIDPNLLFGSAVLTSKSPLIFAAFLKRNLPATRALLKLQKLDPDQVGELQFLAAFYHLPEFLELFLDLGPPGPIDQNRQGQLIHATFRYSLNRMVLGTDTEAGDALKRILQLILGRSGSCSRGDTQELMALIISHLIAGHYYGVYTYFCTEASLDCLNTSVYVTGDYTPNGIKWKTRCLPPIHHAIIANNWDAFEHLLQRGADLRTRARAPFGSIEEISRGPLRTLVSANHISNEDCCRFAKRILRHYQQKSICLDETDREAFVKSFGGGELEFAAILLQFPSFFDINMTDPKTGYTALGWAVMTGNSIAVKEVLKYKPDVFSLPDTGMTALMTAAILHRAGQCDTPQGGCLRTPEIVEEITTLLLDYFNADQIRLAFELRGQILTALHLACGALNWIFLKVLIRHPHSRSLLNLEASVGGETVTALDILDVYRKSAGEWNFMLSFTEGILETHATPCERAHLINTQLNMVAMLENEGCRRYMPTLDSDSDTNTDSDSGESDEGDKSEDEITKMRMEMILETTTIAPFAPRFFY